MTVEGWKMMIETVVRDIADSRFQEQAWFGLGPDVSSPDELYCQLFDDAMFDQFLDGNPAHLTASQLAAASALRLKMNEYQLDDKPDPRKVIDSPGWEAIRCAAQNFLRTFTEENRREDQEEQPST
jgi:hypothetical protein